LHAANCKPLSTKEFREHQASNQAQPGTGGERHPALAWRAADGAVDGRSSDFHASSELRPARQKVPKPPQIQGGLANQRYRSYRLEPERPQLLNDLWFGGKPALFLLVEEDLVIGRHDEDSAAPADDLGIDPEGLFDLGRQTGGPWKVVSNAAVVDSDMHGGVLLRRS
jgi:hypothetical protein